MGVAAHKIEDKETQGEKKPKAVQPPQTPMMSQYWEIKNQNKDHLLFFRMGDFYELFFEDAVQAAAVLDITLTKRGKQGGEGIPMCGVPWHQLDPYLAKLISNGYSVAICDQTETPEEAKKRGGYKALVKREVIRIVTPGTLTEENLLNQNQNNYLAAIGGAKGELAIAWLEMSTGEFFVQSVTAENVESALTRLNATEILVSDSSGLQQELFKTWGAKLKAQPASWMQSDAGEHRLKSLYGIDSLESLGPLSRAQIGAAGAIIHYVEITQKGKLPQINRLQALNDRAIMEVDPSTLRNLEILRTTDGNFKGSLLSVMDRCLTATGGRMLSSRLAAPLTDVSAINKRLEVIQAFVDSPTLQKDIAAKLPEFPDIERALSRIMLDRASPRDLAAIRDGLQTAVTLRELSRDADIASPMLRHLFSALTGYGELITELTHALAENLPFLARDGGFIKKGYSPQLDEFRSLRDESKKHILNLQGKYIEITGIPTLKIRHNNVLGYYAEVSPKQADKVPDQDNGPFIHRQTLASAVRYTTTELADLEAKLSKADEQAQAIEMQLFEKLCEQIKEAATLISDAAQTVAQIDIAATQAQLATEENFCCPVLNESLDFAIEGGRHPVVEAALKKEGDLFIKNNCDFKDGQKLWLLTGPNMAGKSTFLRQNALIVVLAQTGLFVPADKATLGVVDRLFSRVGASDDLARGHSTFMVEMIETATILNRATERSLVILDEIGRGTATYDGMSIAWGTLEHLHEANKCRGLFATHYHELTTLSNQLTQLSCFTMRVKEWQDKIVFLHEVIAGHANRSYGIHVAELAGLPKGVIQRAQQVLQALEENEQGAATTKLAEDLPLFQAVQETAPSFQEKSAALEKLETIHPDDMTPREALDALYEIKRLAE